MKLKFVLAALFSFVILTTNAQFRKIPVEATNAFKAKFTDAQNVSWKGGLTSYKANFDLNNTNYTAEFNNEGEWVKTEARLTYDKLPLEVADGFHKSMYNGWEHTELTQIEEKGKEIEYRIRVKKSRLEKKYLYFNAKGQLLRESITL
jgi:hypothetical protein